ncbi:MAG: TIGR00159 family protein [Polyangiaceae bacterium]|nr:TIGR00159 family protein [Polyangiaceae bacterium]
MLEALERLFAGRSVLDIARDFVDIFIVAYVVYRVLLMVRGTRAMQVGMGLAVVFLLYLVAKWLQLVTLLSLLSYVLSSLILIVVVVFQSDIRRALIRVGGRAWFTGRRKQEQSRVIDEVVAAVTELARHRIGAIIAFEQDANLGDFTQREGVVINAAVTRELLVAVFYPESVNKLHDGAVVIRDLKIARAGVFFPMPEQKEGKLVDRSMGTRHQAALGITEETDAVVVVVSEERGTISFCFNGNIVPNIDATALRQSLVGLLEHRAARDAAREAAREAARDVSPASSGPQSSRTGAASGGSSSIAPPPPAIVNAPTSTPLPKVRLEKKPDRSGGEATSTPIKGVSTPMPRPTKSLLPTPPKEPKETKETKETKEREPKDTMRPSAMPEERASVLPDEPPVSDRNAFVPARPTPAEEPVSARESRPEES